MYSQYEDRYVAELEEDLKSLRTQLAKANERVKELEGQLQLTTLTTHEASFESGYGKKRLNKFAIDKVADGFERHADICEAFCASITPETLREHAKQLRKEQE